MRVGDRPDRRRARRPDNVRRGGRRRERRCSGVGRSGRDRRRSQWGFAEVPGVWDVDAGMSFGDADFTTVLLTPAERCRKAAPQPTGRSTPDDAATLMTTIMRRSPAATLTTPRIG